MAFLDDAYALIIRGSGRIADLIPHIVVEESHQDKLAITQHPVEKGAQVSDHAYVAAKVVEMRIGWSDSRAGFTGASRIEYEALVALQAEREPFTVSTGKRNYKNMLVAGISVTNDQRTKHAVMATVTLQEVRIVSVKGGGSGSDDPSNHSSPESTVPTQDLGGVTTRNLGSTESLAAAGLIGPGGGIALT